MISREEWAILLIKNRERVLAYIQEFGSRSPSGCFLLSGANTIGYPVMSIKTSHGWRAIKISRLVLALANKLDISDGKQGALHHCDTPACVEIEHLFPGSQKHNMQDAAKKCRTRVPRLSGENHPGRKLSLEQVAEIRTSTQPQRKLAARFGVSKSAVWSIQNGLTWRVPAC